MVNNTLKHVMLGAVSEEATRLFSMYGLGKTGAYYSKPFLSPTGKYVWGIGTNDLLSLGVGASMLLYGNQKRNAKWKEIGSGWLLGFTCVKLIAEPLYGLIMAYDPVYPKGMLSSNNNSNGARQSVYQMQNPANPQGQLMIGNKGATGKTVYKPNLSAPACAGSHAADQQLFI